MFRNNIFIALSVSAAFFGCVTAPIKTPSSVPPTPVPTLTKTFGEFAVQNTGAVLIHYKDIYIAANPLDNDVPTPALVDYLLVTVGDDAHLTALKDPPFRQAMKIMGSPSVVPGIKKKGYANVKSVTPGERICLKKNGAFLFVSAAGPGFLFEFDNGRNIFLSGSSGDTDSYREFVYSLRDDGKEIHAAILMTPTEGTTADLTVLLQPQMVFYCPLSNGKWNHNVDEKSIRHALADQLFSGTFSIAVPGDKIAF